MATAKTDVYIEGIGRRKESVARVRITPASKTSFVVNDKTVSEYFKTETLQRIVQEALNEKGDFSVSIKVSGGGVNSQAESIRLGIARALIKDKPDLRKDLKSKGFLKRDPRVKERRKFGLKKARKAAQWSKR
ncbi:MAG: 30S ribosomal protein S9 [Candidatus Pacebacteria bacterium]|nr:30S ribosomal protein S9 [Candidatus Paceibacterota bacterium]